MLILRARPAEIAHPRSVVPFPVGISPVKMEVERPANLVEAPVGVDPDILRTAQNVISIVDGCLPYPSQSLEFGRNAAVKGWSGYDPSTTPILGSWNRHPKMHPATLSSVLSVSLETARVPACGSVHSDGIR
jgi:hypothetical protein